MPATEAQRAKLQELGRDFPSSWAVAFLTEKLGARPGGDLSLVDAMEFEADWRLGMLTMCKAALPWLTLVFLVPACLRLRKPWPRRKHSERLQNLWPLALTLSVVMGVELAGHLAEMSLFRWLGQSGLWAGLARSLGSGWTAVAGLGLSTCLFAARPLLVKAMLAPRWGGLWQVLGVKGRDFLRLRLWCIGLGGAFAVVCCSLQASLLLDGRGWGNPVLDAASRWPFGGSPVYQVMIFLWMVVLAPVIEEMIFRGFLLAAFRQRLGAGLAVVLTALLFAAGHAYSLKGTVAVFMGGLILGAIRVRTRRLAASIITHSLVNLLGYAFFALLNVGEG